MLPGPLSLRLRAASSRNDRRKGANWAISMSCPKLRRKAVVNRSTAAFARHDLGGASCGCRVGQVSAIRRFKLITSSTLNNAFQAAAL